MKLAEALALRADLQTRLEHLQRRSVQVMRIQEGDEPEEDPRALIAEYTRTSAELCALIARISQVNATTAFDDTSTIADALARRDQAKKDHRFFLALEEAASVRQDRYSRSEIKYVTTVPVSEIRARADEAARRYRELDVQLQQKNWTTDMPED
ncbi:hypothetical protein C1Y63_00220 [Corynebacterium sp. 13CS0277]|uniref:DIP1984 family protein n=1 Tax=Corynebacterium sp. 13CS0277 TaxID=2071994 RepID=UPI000D024421|nr:DIP1984 family protein [Corynebacterium sp. 13CS0277]PRQ12523.1 hypothetical protein C1Y63_00220 [Corynebacterium sp. 13CS0277]